jgi:hypothetical protein
LQAKLRQNAVSYRYREEERLGLCNRVAGFSVVWKATVEGTGLSLIVDDKVGMSPVRVFVLYTCRVLPACLSTQGDGKP